MFFTLLLLSGVVRGQQRSLPEEDWYRDIKKGLADHYVGRVVRLKLALPASRRGLELYDGQLQSGRPQSAPPVATLGDELTIRTLRVAARAIEFTFAKSGEEPATFYPPRITIHFSREVNSQDLTIEKLNRILGQVIDTASLIEVGRRSDSRAAVSVATGGSEPFEAEILADLPGAKDRIGELTVESEPAGARVYLDGAFSGPAPRTVRVDAGLHTILVIREGLSWERRVNVRGGKISLVRVDLKSRH